ncbi:transporter substrate-binding domain-containing protein [Permianibacter sp. IMCC34836]|uniref:substrate-binding periplasmic protein n=1 Tax=Permianibacter fluminis TaxID=2738515 RepID=UPI001556AB16|nr:transporter substrate-binding domain-containing protein [Permianibacter fluminis]NQD37596.1 transporter substrate-binding domain-containing protein [Permianibacter fluminis]
MTAVPRILLLTLAFSSLVGLSAPAQAEPPLVRACDNDQDYPPFRWRETGADGQLMVRGLGYTLIRDILARNGWRLELDLLPLKRCQQEVANGERYQLLINSSPNPERIATYLLTEPFAQVHFHSFYLQSRYPDFTPVLNKRDLRSLRVCGIAGHNFAMFDLPSDRIDMGPENFAAAFRMLRNGRCDVLPYNLETIEGLRIVGQDVLASGEIAHHAIGDMQPSPLVMAISRNYRYGPSLKRLIDRELATMRASGQLERLQQEFRHAAAKNPEVK